MKKILLSLFALVLGFVGQIAEGYNIIPMDSYPLGSIENPIRSPQSINFITTTGVYYFDINNILFSTTVTPSGLMLITSSNSATPMVSTGYAESTGIFLGSETILSKNIIQSLSFLEGVQIDTWSGVYQRAYSTEINVMNQLRNYNILSAGTSSDAWSSSGFSLWRTCASVNVPLNQGIYHACNNTMGLHWVPVGGQAASTYTVPARPEENLALWAKISTGGISNPQLTITAPTTYITGNIIIDTSFYISDLTGIVVTGVVLSGAGNTGFQCQYDVQNNILCNSGQITQPGLLEVTVYSLNGITLTGSVQYFVSQYILSFEEEGGTEVLDQTGIIYNTTGTNPGAPIKTGYVFNGWYLSGASTPFDFSIPITGDTTLYAQRDLALYTLFFEENGGTVVSDQTGIIYNGTGFDPGPITKSGFIFEGWYYSGYTIPFDFTIPLTGDATAYAMRTPFVDYRTEHYLQNPDYSYPSTPVDTLLASGVSDSTIYAIPNTYTGYIFDPSVSGTLLSGIIAQDGSLVMKLYYPLIRYTLSFEEEGGTEVLDQTGIAYNTPGTDPGTPIKTGYIFSGWYLSGAAMPFNFSTPITADTTLTAQWTPIPVVVTYTLSFEENGGTLVTDQTGIILNGTGTQPTNPIKTGYTFGGWYTSPSLTTAYNFTAPITQNTTLYAKWTAQSSGGGGGGYTIVDPETFNPTVETTCFTPLDKKTVDQGIQVSEAFKIAHQMLYSYELTRWQGTKDYRPFDYLTREEAARFMVEFAINVLCRKPNRSYTDNFNDLEISNPTLTKYIRMSYEYDIFHGDQIDESSKVSTTFRPKDKISRDEIIATMVRLVTNEYDEGLGESWASQYKSFLSRHVKAQLNSNARKDIAVTIYDLYRNNDYHMEDIGYVITY